MGDGGMKHRILEEGHKKLWTPAMAEKTDIE
jgi:hypothetical protein